MEVEVSPLYNDFPTDYFPSPKTFLYKSIYKRCIDTRILEDNFEIIGGKLKCCDELNRKSSFI